jgi:Concanavalin A-like lectin/glucanases superfamily
MDNSDILNNDVFISVYVIAMFFLPIFFIFSLSSLNLSKSMIEFITIAVFLALTCVFLFLCITKIKDAVSMSNYLTIIFISMFFVPLFTLSYYSNTTEGEAGVGNKIGTIWKLFGNLMTIALIICVVFLNLITSGDLNYIDAIPNEKNVKSGAFIALIVIASLIGVGGLAYLVPMLIKYINDLRSGEAPATNFSEMGPSFLSGIFYLFYTIKDIVSGIGNIFNNFLNNIMKSLPSDEDKQNAFTKYGLLYGFIFMIGVLLYMAAFDPTALTTKEYVYTFSAIVPLVLLLGFVIPFSTQQRSATTTTLLIGIFVTVMIGILYSYSSMNSKSFEYMSYIINFIMFLIVVVGLAIFFYIFNNYLKSIEGFLGFMIYLIFYIPCLLIDFYNYVLNEFQMTSRPVYILFFTEILLILLYIYLPMLLQYFVTKSSDTIVLLDKSEFLDARKVIGNSYQLRMTIPDVPGNTLSDNVKYAYRKSYAISMWTYLNIQPPNNASYAEETTIFDYGNGKPKITYYNNMSSDKTQNKYIFYFTDSTTNPASYSLTLPSQKWNYIVFNYYSDKVDLFINGILERTFVFHENMPNYLAIDHVVIGSDPGLDGAICNVNYFTSPLSKSKISGTYNLLMAKNPPTFSE